ncbi:MAG: hypothetical protein ACT6R2_20405, partial [Blastomonas fulva]|uniref:hypothetical protein n=1 Tax=Blastomonas fulva TaxID=1550728 RepID=UPI004033BA95
HKPVERKLWGSLNCPLALFWRGFGARVALSAARPAIDETNPRYDEPLCKLTIYPLARDSG